MNAPTPRITTNDDLRYPHNVFSSPYFYPAPLWAVLAPAINDYLDAQLPILLPPYIDPAAEAAVQQYAVLLAGSTMSGPLFLSPLLPTAPSQAATKDYVDTMVATSPTFADLAGYLPLTGGTLSGRLIVRTAAVPSVVVYDTVGNTSSGMWEAGGNLWIGATDGTGNPTGSYARWNANQLLVQGEVRAMGFTDFGLTATAQVRQLQFNGQFLFYFDDASGDLSWLNNTGPLWVMRDAGTCEAVQGPVAGAGPYINTLAPLDQQLEDRVTTLEAEVAALRGGGVTLPARGA